MTDTPPQPARFSEEDRKELERAARVMGAAGMVQGRLVFAALAHIDTTHQLLREVCEELKARGDSAAAQNKSIAHAVDRRWEESRAGALREARTLVLNKAKEHGIEIGEER